LEQWYFYHDALSQLTAGDSVEWMQEKGYYKHWLLPALDMQPTGDWRDQFPPGNTPEWCCHDVGCNQDLHLAVDRHCLATSHLTDEDDHKFSISTPKRGTDGCPSGKRLKRDIQFFEHACWEIYKHRGAVVPGLGDRKGKRQQASADAMEIDGTKAERRGGVRKRNVQKQIEELKQQWWHTDAVSELGVKIEKSLLSAKEIEAWDDADASDEG
jgi:hypothetical protein